MFEWEVHFTNDETTESTWSIEGLIERVWNCSRIGMPDYRRVWREAVKERSVTLAMQLSTYRYAFDNILHEFLKANNWEGTRLTLECVYIWLTDKERRAWIVRYSWPYILPINLYGYLLSRGCFPVAMSIADPKMIWLLGTMGIGYQWLHDHEELKDSLDRMCCLLIVPYVSGRKVNGSRLKRRPNVMVMYDKYDK
jgi:hypothetical protein